MRERISTRGFVTALVFCFLAAGVLARAAEDKCLECHNGITPGIVADWKASAHAAAGVSCDACHGDKHTTIDDTQNAVIPTPDTCAPCHKEQVEQFKRGKHAKAWEAMKAMPTFHWQPMAFTEGMKGCGGCHKIGLKTDAELKELIKTKPGYGVASCDSCHTRHLFSKAEALQPQACQTCHMGFDHAQWEMYSSSKHGVRFLMKQGKIIPDSVPAPSCQSCHIANGNHENRTAWGFLGVRLPMPEDKSWADDRTVILQALGVLDPEGNPTTRLEAVKQNDMVRLTEESWQERRQAMVKQCAQCHSRELVEQELKKDDGMIREADRLMAEAIRLVAGLYQDKLIPKPAQYAYAFPDVLTFHDAATPVEQRLFVMFEEYRMRTFQGAFHMNPDYTFWYGWSGLKQALTDIKSMAEDLRRKK